MAFVLTNSGSAGCGHGGTMTIPPSASVLTVGGVHVPVDSLKGAAIAPGCSQTNTNAGQQPCSSVVSQTAGKSVVLFVDGKAALLDNSSGNTDGKPLTDWAVKSAGQSFFSAD